jgi:hypothetical protein
MFLARIALRQRRTQDAARMLDSIALDGIGPELQAQVHYWQSQMLAVDGDRAASDARAAQARKVMEGLRATIPDRYRDSFDARPDVRFALR